MSYQVLARKWRPRQFSEVVGQEHVLKALANGLDQGRVHHAFLFTGTRGVGKTTIARIFSKALNCETGTSATPCGECSTCTDIDAGRFVDLIEIDAASRTGVDDIRDILDNVQYAPARGRTKVYLIDEVHMLSTHAFNALLKTLEEPPEHVKFLLATTDPQKLPVTVLSRCLQFHLRKLSAAAIAEHLAWLLEQEKIPAEEGALKVLAQSAEGSVRDSLSLLDQAIAFGGGEVQEEAVRAMLGTVGTDAVANLLSLVVDSDIDAVITQVAELDARAADFGLLLQEMAALLQRIALAKAGASQEAIDGLKDEQLVDKLAAEEVQLFYSICLRANAELEWAPDPRAGFEMTMLRMLAFRPDGASGSSRRAQPAVQGQADSQPAAGVAEPEAGSSHGANTTTPSAAVNSAPTTVTAGLDNWSALLDQLKLGGMSRELARHCTVGEHDQQRVQLLLDTAAVGLLNERARKKLEEALVSGFGRPIKLTIDLAAAGDAAAQEVPQPAQAAETVAEAITPAVQAEESAQNRQAEAVAAVKADPNVQRAQELFGAEICEDSITPAS